MRPISVRARLTLLVVLITGVAVAVFTSWGSSQVEDAMIDRALDTLDVPTLITPAPALADGDTLVALGPGPDPAEFLIDTAAFLRSAAADGSGAAADLFALLGIDPDRPLPLALAPTAVALVAEDHLTVVPADSVDTAVSLFLAQDVAFALGDPGLGFTPANRARGDDDYAFRVIDRPGADVVVGQPVGDIRETVRRMRRALLAVSPLLVLVAAATTWLLASRALRPVKLMTAQVDEIGSGTTSARVPEPRTRDEIAHLARTMNAMLDRIASVDTARRQFVSDASHELRSPLTVIRGEAEMAAADPQVTDVATIANSVLTEARRLERVVDDLLALARLDEGRVPSDVAVLDLDDVVLEEASRRRRVPVDVHGVSAGRVRASASGMRRVVQHLLDNAATHAASRVAIGLRSDGASVMIDVHDDGPGIEPGQRERVFERFTRLDEARARQTGGAGLGLSVVAALVTEAGGTVQIGESATGAHFIVRIPATH